MPVEPSLTGDAQDVDASFLIQLAEICVAKLDMSKKVHHTSSLFGHGAEGVGTSGPKPQDSGSARDSGDCKSCSTKRKQLGSDNGDDEGSSLCTDTSDGGKEQKRPRMVWNEDLKRRFDIAVDTLGPDAVPKAILQMMNVKALTRENVASHLQKYRQNLKKYGGYSSTDDVGGDKLKALQNQYIQHTRLISTINGCVGSTTVLNGDLGPTTLLNLILPPPPSLNVQLAPPPPLLSNPNIVWGIPVEGVCHGEGKSFMGFPTYYPGRVVHQGCKSPEHPYVPQNSKLLEGYFYPTECPWPTYAQRSELGTNAKHVPSGDYSTDTCAETSVSEQPAIADKAAAQEAEEGVPSIDDTETRSPRKDGP